MWVKIDAKNDKIKECKWQTFGCASAIAATSILSVMVTEKGGMKIDKAMQIRPQDIVKRLGGLPDRKIHCSVLGDQALRSALNDYFHKSEQDNRIVK
jgi:NifU-like protein involved in Fe-S cluster formation